VKAPENPPEVAVSSTRVYDGRVVRLRVDEIRSAGGRRGTREVVEHPGAVAIVPLLPGPRVVLLRQWRYCVGGWLLEIPAGTLEPGEEPLECARRELIEETGHAAARVQPVLSFYTTPGFSTEILRIFLATELTPKEARQDEDELLETVAVEWDEAVAMCLDGRIRDAKTIAGMLAVDRILASA
jgi:ADP-ribose pyrophosphatase